MRCKLVEAKHELGLYVVAADYLDAKDSPAKILADKHYVIDVNNVDAIVDMCRQEKICAVLSTHLDPYQRPYQKICERLGLPCLGTEKQFRLLTDKQAFKQLCRDNGVDIIPDFIVQDILEDTVSYPVFIKPADSRGSRGQSVCYNKKQALNAAKIAKDASSSGRILIAKYMQNAEEVQLHISLSTENHTCCVHLDSYRGKESDHLEKVVIYYLSLSKYTAEYLAGAHKNIVSMLKRIGIKNGPVMMQGFMTAANSGSLILV